MPDYSEYSQDLSNVLNAIKAKSVEATKLKNLDQFKFAEGTFTVYKAVKTNNTDKNGRLVLNFEFKGKNFLFASDIDKAIEKQMYWKNVDVLKVANKGKKDSTDYLFLVKTNPKTAVIIEDKKGHDDEVSQLIKKFTNDIYIANDKDIVQITYDGQNMKKEVVTNPLKPKIVLEANPSV